MVWPMSIFGVVAILVVADRTRGTGRFNLVGGGPRDRGWPGGALSTFIGGKLIEHYNFRVSFLALGGVAAIALALLWFCIPETLNDLPQR